MSCIFCSCSSTTEDNADTYTETPQPFGRGANFTQRDNDNISINTISSSEPEIKRIETEFPNTTTTQKISYQETLFDLEGFGQMQLSEPFVISLKGKRNYKLYLIKKENSPADIFSNSPQWAIQKKARKYSIVNQSSKAIYIPFGTEFPDSMYLLNDVIVGHQNSYCTPSSFGYIDAKKQDDIQERDLISFLHKDVRENPWEREDFHFTLPWHISFLLESSEYTKIYMKNIQEEFHKITEWHQNYANPYLKFNFIQYSQYSTVVCHWISGRVNPNVYKNLLSSINAYSAFDDDVNLHVALARAKEMLKSKRGKRDGLAKAEKECIFIISGSNPNSITNLQTELLNCKNEGIEVLVYYIGQNYTPSIYKNVGVNSFQGLPSGIFYQFQSSLKTNTHPISPSVYHLTEEEKADIKLSEEEDEKLLKDIDEYLKSDLNSNGFIVFDDAGRLIFCDLYYTSTIWNPFRKQIQKKLHHLLSCYCSSKEESSDSNDIKSIFYLCKELNEQMNSREYCIFQDTIGNSSVEYSLYKTNHSGGFLQGFSCFLADKMYHLYMVALPTKLTPR